MTTHPPTPPSPDNVEGHGPTSFDDLLADIATGDAPRAIQPSDSVISEHERAAAALHVGLTPSAHATDSFKARLTAQGEAVVRTKDATPAVAASAATLRAQHNWPTRLIPWLAAAAAIGIALTIYTSYTATLRQREQSLADARAELEAAQNQIKSNESLLAAARARATELETQLAQTTSTVTENQRLLAEANAKSLDMAERLAAITADLDNAQLQIAQFNQPVDPATLQLNRQKLLDVPGTVRLAWSPFDLPDAPAEQPNVAGDVVWNDDLQEGYLRFAGLKVNDPAVEQYQVWVIDERGMEQKVSGGVFNASADGEVIVPIHPGIDVGRVALFAITIEKPGGTWVPDLARRVVLAPRGDG